jgi:hypothetical protein
MKPVLVISCFVVLVLTAVAVRADIPRPKPTATPAGTLSYSSIEIVPDSKATNATLQIRQSEFNNLRAGLDGTPQKQGIVGSIANSRTRTIIAGLLLFMSVSFAGVWLARSARTSQGAGRGQKAIAIAIIGVATLGAAAIVTRGNAGPPPSYRWRNLATALAAGESTAGPVVLQVVPDDQLPNTGARLTIPLKKQNKKGEDE